MSDFWDGHYGLCTSPLEKRMLAHASALGTGNGIPYFVIREKLSSQNAEDFFKNSTQCHSTDTEHPLRRPYSREV